MTRWGIVLVLGCAGCGDDAAMPDGLQLVDGPVDAAQPDAAIDAPGPACPNPSTDAGGGGMYTLYINAEGVTLQKGQCNNSRTNCTGLITPLTFDVPPFKAGDPNRQVFIDQIALIVQRELLPYSVDVVTTRPASGDYNMIVLGGDCTMIGQQPPCNVLGVASLSCSLTNRDQLSLDFDLSTLFPDARPEYYASLMLSDVGIFSNMSVTTTQGDCTCRTCGPPANGVCSFGNMSAVATQGRCPNAGATQDEPQLLKTAYGCRP